LVQIDTEMTKKYSNQRYAVDYAVSTRIQISNTTRYSSRIAFLPTTPAFDTPVWGGGGSRQNIATPFGACGKTMEWCGYTRRWKKIKDIFIRFDTLTNVSDTQTHTQRNTAWQHRPRLCIASRGKNVC